MALLDAVGIVVPVKNEAQLLPACIASIRAAVEHARLDHPEVVVAVGFVLDGCTDDSAEIIQTSGYRWVNSRLPGVGAARATGVDWLLGGLRVDADERTLIACTDADTTVPRDWLVHQINLANEGVDVIVGAVRPNLDELDTERRRAWEFTHLDGQARGHVHGANLGLRASTYRAAGGFTPVLEHEDVDLVTRALATGAQVRATEAHCVITSGRLEGRTMGGYAGYLRRELIALAQSTPEEQSVA